MYIDCPYPGGAAQSHPPSGNRTPLAGCGCILVAWASCPCQRFTTSITGGTPVPPGERFSGQPSSSFRICHRLAAAGCGSISVAYARADALPVTPRVTEASTCPPAGLQPAPSADTDFSPWSPARGKSPSQPALAGLLGPGDSSSPCHQNGATPQPHPWVG